MGPINLYEFEAEAKQVLSHDVWEHIAGGDQDELTLRRNREAFDRVTLWPRRLVEVRNRDLTTTVLGHKIGFPVMLAPAGIQACAHPEGELAVARAAGTTGTIMVLATNSSFSMEDVARIATGPIWFQLSHYTNELSQMLIQRAEAVGYTALCITVDEPTRSRSERNRRNRFRRKVGIEFANFVGERAGLGLVFGTPEASLWERPPHTPVTWSDIHWFRSITKLPIVLKGIMTAEDAKLCVEHGVDGIIVSNHGGRVLDCQAASIEALPEVVDAVNGRCEVYMDSGVRRGSDVVKALAHGARAVFIGRPFLWGLAVNGEAGVKMVLDILREEVDLILAHCGRPTIACVDRSLVGNTKQSC